MSPWIGRPLFGLAKQRGACGCHIVVIQDENFFETAVAKTNIESAGTVGNFNWHLILPTNARVSPLTYSAVVATRYVELCAKKEGKWTIGTFAEGATLIFHLAFTQCYGMQDGAKEELVALMQQHATNTSVPP